MPDAEKPDLKLLGSSSDLPQSPSVEILETFPNHSPNRKYWIKLDCAEFSSHCPVTGQPDYAKLQIAYIPGELCVETKSLKYYLASYRSTAAFNEEIVNRIADDIMEVCKPQKLEVFGQFAARGGISLSVEVTYPEPD